MHDVGRIQAEFEPEFEPETFNYEFSDQEGSYDQESESPFGESEEMELAAELLEITDEAELDQFLGNLIKKAGRAIGKVVRSPVGKALGGILKGAAKAALPVLGTAAGGFVGGPAGAALGGKLAAGAGRLFGLEMEGMSPEDQEFEVARRFVRFAGASAGKAAAASPAIPATTAVKTATVAAAKKFAPGLLRGRRTIIATGSGSCGAAPAGRWLRRGNRIILLGV